MSGGEKPGQKKSGLVKLAPGHILFHDAEVAQSLYIIQKGQIRLFKPKGQGYIELAVLRTGEVLGEMAYFDEKGARRSCSAEAMVSTEVIEISFAAFSKAIENLNPWFKTIITALADRLRKTNAKVKELESNSMSGGYGAQANQYTFLKLSDLVRLLGLVYMTTMSHGKTAEAGALQITSNVLKFYLVDIYNFQEVKAENFFTLLEEQGYLQRQQDEKGKPSIFIFPDIQKIRSLMTFFHAQRSTADDGRMKVSAKCEAFLEAMLRSLKQKGIVEDRAPIMLGPMLEQFKERRLKLETHDLDEAIALKLVEAPMVGKENQLSTVVDFKRLRESLPGMQMWNALDRLNQSKGAGK